MKMKIMKLLQQDSQGMVKVTSYGGGGGGGGVSELLSGVCAEKRSSLGSLWGLVIEIDVSAIKGLEMESLFYDEIWWLQQYD